MLGHADAGNGLDSPENMDLDHPDRASTPPMVLEPGVLLVDPAMFSPTADSYTPRRLQNTTLSQRLGTNSPRYDWCPLSTHLASTSFISIER